MSHGMDSKQRQPTDSTTTSASLKEANPGAHAANAAARQLVSSFSCSFPVCIGCDMFGGVDVAVGLWVRVRV